MKFLSASILLIALVAEFSSATTLRGTKRQLQTDSWQIWDSSIHDNAVGSYNETLTCFEQKDRLGIVSLNDGTEDYFTVSPDKWVSGGLRFGCVHKNDSWQCDAACFPFDNTNPDWSEKQYITFKAKIGGTPDCVPSVTVTGGGWPRLSSNKIELKNSYVDSGSLVSDEWRNVMVPLADFKTTEWGLNNVYGMYFQSCYSNNNPKYYISSLTVTNDAIEIIGPEPTAAPTPVPSSWSIWDNSAHDNAVGSYNETLTCFEQKDRLGIVSLNDGTEDYFTVSPDKWVSGGLRFGCVHKDDSWQCDAACFPFDNTNPDCSEKQYITFKAKIGGTPDCVPSVTVTGGGWPRLSSNKIELKDSYVDSGSLNSDEWRNVMVPLADFKTTEWGLNNVYGMYFQSCYSNNNPKYYISSLTVTNDAIEIITPPPTDPPTLTPTYLPTTVPPTDSPTTLAPSAPPTPVPSSWSIWDNSAHDNAVGSYNETLTCFEQKDRLGIVSLNDGTEDYFTVSPDKWVSGGLRFGCVHKDDSYQCDAACFPFDNTNPDWSEKQYITFKAKIGGTPDCVPSVSVSGGGWPRLSSNIIELQDSYVDAGYLSTDEWRNVMIPLDDLKTVEWDLSNVFGMYFRSCYSDNNPKYYISSLTVSNEAIDLISSPPSLTPSAYVTDDPLLATHRFVHTNWYPILGPEYEPVGNTWVEAENNMWPVVSEADPQTVTVYIPPGQSVIYSGNDQVKYDKIVVEGSLTILPLDSDVSITVGTIVVEEGGALEVKTDTSTFTVTIEIEGALDTERDPEEQMLGIVGLQGNITIIGNDVATNKAKLAEIASSGSNSLVLLGADLGLAVGGELVLPDTQTGLDVAHYKFPANSDYVDQTEFCTIISIESVLLDPSGGTAVTCEQNLSYDHSAGFTAGYMTRSVNLVKSPSSTDRGHILHTGTGKFEVRNTRIENFGRTTTELIDSTVMAPTDLKFGDGPGSGIAQMNVTKLGTNQIARYALHAHQSRVEGYFTGNAVLFSPRDGMVAHDSRVYILDNVIVGADGTGIFLEDSTETGPVERNYIIGTGGGTRGGDDGRFAIQKGKDMAFGGFGIWGRGKLALVKDNHCEGHFGRAPYGFFVHPLFLENKRVPDVPGTPQELIGKTGKEISKMVGPDGLQLQTYGGFINNSAIATFQVGLDLAYFGISDTDTVGSIIEGANIQALASSGRGISTTHSSVFTLNEVTIEGLVPDNSLTGIWCNNCNECTLSTPNTTLVIDNVETIRGGNC